MLQIRNRFLSSVHQRFATTEVFEEAFQKLVGIDRTVCEQFPSRHLLAIVDHHIASQKDRVFTDRIVGLNHVDGKGIVVFPLLNFNRSRLPAKNGGFPRTTRFKKFLNPWKTLNNVSGLLAFEHQESQAIAPLNQVTITDVEQGVGRHHVRTTKAKRDAAAINSFHLTATIRGLSTG